jgi:hypothetical protein
MESDAESATTGQFAATGKAEPALCSTIGKEGRCMCRFMTASVMTLALVSALMLRPTPAISTEACIASVAAISSCAFQCINDIELLCGTANPACHQFNAQFFRTLASTPASSPACPELLATALAVTHDVCGCTD